MRSLLFVPGDSEKKLAKAADTRADALIFDLEDAVAPSGKEAARFLTQAHLAGLTQNAPPDPYTKQRPQWIVRINALDTPFWEDDLRAIVPAKPDAIMVPKTLSGTCISRVSALLDALEQENGLTGGYIRLCNVATETAASLFSLNSYAGCSPRFFAMTWGAEDLAADLGAQDNKDAQGHYTSPYQLARTLCLLGAAAARVQAIDGIYQDFRDAEGLRNACEIALRDGFTGKLAIHPAQIPVINAAFTPTPEALAKARRIIQAFDEADGAGVVALDGVMLDRPHLRQAQALLARAEPSA